ncbi:hypothetical protein F5884DRAFT_772201 [Xylogone sp. PMI_703]|nr:hypothetical protein F5884DRAFT_772201 [Xylogone sp. PMI_703]
MANVISSLVVLAFSIWAIFSIHLFAIHNGTLSHLGTVIDSGVFSDGSPLIPITTGGRYPKIDWQIRAPAAFLWPFGDGGHPDNSLAGIAFAGAWASSWILIVLESLRKCNRWRVVSFVSIWGILQFNHSNALITPIWLALHLLTSPSAFTPTADDIWIEPVHLLVLPISVVLGFVIPLAPVMLPFSVISVEMKQTAMGWYQQWPLWIALPHYAIVALLRPKFSSSRLADKTNVLVLYRYIYAFASAFAILTHIPVMVVSCTASLWSGLFNPEYVKLIQMSHLLVPMNPFSEVQAKDLAEGMFWLIQWDYFSGYIAPIFWSLILYRKAQTTVHKNNGSWSYIWKRVVLYFLISGPIGIAVGLIWERDEMLLDVSSKTPEEQPLLANAE